MQGQPRPTASPRQRRAPRRPPRTPLRAPRRTHRPYCRPPDLEGDHQGDAVAVPWPTIVDPIVGYGFFSNAPAGALDETGTFNIGRNGYVVDSLAVQFRRFETATSRRFNLTSHRLTTRKWTRWRDHSLPHYSRSHNHPINETRPCLRYALRLQEVYCGPLYRSERKHDVLCTAWTFSGSSRLILDVLDSTGEDAGRASGWSINNFVLQKGRGSTADWSHPASGIVRIRVNGTAGTTPNPSPSCAAPDLAGRHRIWTGEVTVGVATIVDPIVGYGFFSNAPAGALDETTFNIGRNGYVVDSVSVIDGDLSFNLTSHRLTDAEVDALRVHVCDTPYDFSDAVRHRSNNLYRWTDDLDWSLVEFPHAVSEPAGGLPPGSAGGGAHALSAQSVSGKPGYLRLSWTPAGQRLAARPHHRLRGPLPARRAHRIGRRRGRSATTGPRDSPTRQDRPRRRGAETTHRSSTTSTRTPSTRSRCARPTPTVRAGGRTG